MKPITCLAISSIFCISTASQATEQSINLGNVTGGTFKKAHTIIDIKCTACHSSDKIDIALSSGRDMGAIQKEMEKRGVRLSSNEREVLGIFWKQSKPISKK
jgi:uncharacterized membrane protein